jgi:hypothetical protein
MKYKYAVISFTITPVETEGGLDNNLNEREQRFNVIVPIEAVKAIDFNKIRNDFMKNSIESFEEKQSDKAA